MQRALLRIGLILSLTFSSGCSLWPITELENLLRGGQRGSGLWPFILLLLGSGSGSGGSSGKESAALGSDIMFVTQVPVCATMDAVTEAFLNQKATAKSAPRGGDLYIKYAEGTYDPAIYPEGLRNLTLAAGFGSSEILQAGLVGQSGSPIAVRQPAVHWNGKKALFSMVIGSPVDPFNSADPAYRWQIYEITGFGPAETPQIVKIQGQPGNFNNIAPFYSSDDKILFISDSPRGQAAHLAPLLDEYERAPTVGGIWRLDPSTPVGANNPRLIQDSPSGAFDPFIDSYGRVVFTKWDHLRVDGFGQSGGTPGGGINYSDESSSASIVPGTMGPFQLMPPADPKYQEFGDDYFPEQSRGDFDPAFALNGASTEQQILTAFQKRKATYVDAYGRTVRQYDFNHFYPWMVNQDGSEEETLNHIGRHEWGGSFNHAVIVDPKLYLEENHPFLSSIANKNFMAGSAGLFQVREDRTTGFFCGVYSLEFRKAATGNIVCFKAAPDVNPDDMALENRTSNGGLTDFGPDGGFRHPLRLSSGEMIAVNTPYPQPADYSFDIDDKGCDQRFLTATDGVTALEINGYDLRLKKLSLQGGLFRAGVPLTGGIQKEVRWYDGSGSLRGFKGALWELDPVEVVERAIPPLPGSVLPDIEKAVVENALDPVSLDLEDLKEWMANQDLALIVGRDVTSRDRGDRGQPYNLKVVHEGQEGVASVVPALPPDATVLPVSYLEIFQGDRIRAYKPSLNLYGYGGAIAGRRILAVPLHVATAQNLNTLGEAVPAREKSMARIYPDGSFAAFVPAYRAMTWQLVGPEDTGNSNLSYPPVVRERNWVSFKAGEVRVCAGCHGLNRFDQSGGLKPDNQPQALQALLEYWRENQ